MLTGDKVETATCIAVSAGFKSRKQQIFYIKDLHSIKDAEFRLKEFEVKS
jgi:magnesium-transporting ATPase (P-type)